MRLDFFRTLIAFIISILLGYGFFSLHTGNNSWVLCFGGGLFTFITAVGTISIDFDWLPRTTIVIRFLSGAFFLIALVSNLIFLFISDFSKPLYIVINGVLILVYVLIAYSVAKAKQ